MTWKPTDCPVCGILSMTMDFGGGPTVECPRCGKFQIGDIAKDAVGLWSKRQRANLSGWIREHQECKLTEPALRSLASLPTPAIGERADRILERLAGWFPKPGTTFSRSTDEPGAKQSLQHCLAGVSCCEDLHELAFLWDDYLINEKHFISPTLPGLGAGHRITPGGWAHLDSLSRGNPSSQQGFIAMCFASSLDPAWMAIDKGIHAAGYRALRINQKEHNNEITDEIIAEIRKSKFLVADLTEHRNGVYFEAGFAKGLDLEVIWLCREDHHTKAHFDVRQFNCILWKDSDLPALTKALKDRIEATLGRGPLPPVASA